MTKFKSWNKKKKKKKKKKMKQRFLNVDIPFTDQHGKRKKKVFFYI